ncbi:response regulator [Alloiococcus sp. CFN-8]|uniref:response regulator n=1 Tax=Alloiococcus sp. CFN-8 TaxID=3416081 RepID=UPI003CECF6A0
MIKAIIVDDEQITRKGLLEYVNWKSADIEVVGEATDGLEGLHLAEKVKPDLAICDVRMPKMDGIEMAKNLRASLPLCSIIFLSGYSDTEYLKSAIKLKATDYIEKPFNLLEFQELINKTADHIRDEKRKRLEEQRKALNHEKSMLYFKNSLIEDILNSSAIDFDKLKDGLELLNIKFPLNGEFLCQLIENRGDNSEKQILQIINNLGIERKITFISGTIENQVIILYRLRHKGDYEELLNYSNDVLDKLNNIHGLSVVSAFGEVKKELNELKESYNEAKEAIKTRGYKINNRVIEYDSNKDKSIIREIEEYIQNNYQKNISINSIASAVYLTPQYLCKLYKKETGKTVNDFITQVRIEASKALLRDRRYKLYEIAERIGYNDANYYARVFKKITGLNPSDYRELH